MGKTLIVNIGSASKKYSLYGGESLLFFAHFEKTENDGFTVSLENGSAREERSISASDFEDSIGCVFVFLSESKIINDKGEVNSVGVRIVAPGEYFLEDRVIDEEYMKKLENSSEIAPLHVVPVIAELRKIKNVLPDVVVLGISDSSFHQTMGTIAKRYAISEEVSSLYGIYRYGYHGLSVSGVVEKIKDLLGGLPGKVIVCHLGSGASITAVKDGKSIDTSMGFTPLEGVPMGSRSGSIDAEAVLFLERSLKMSPVELSAYLNNEAGLLGLSGKTADVRELIELEEKGDIKAKLALDIFAYRVKQFVGAYAAALNGIDMLVFTGTIGERSPKIREKIAGNLSGIGVSLDSGKNRIYTGGKEGFIDDGASRAKVMVSVSAENGAMLKSVYKMI